MPVRPGCPSLNNIEKWRTEQGILERHGIALLLEHYAIRGSELEPDADTMRKLVLAIARDYVPFFRAKKSKRRTLDNHVMARLLRDYQAEIAKGRSPRAARAAARKNLPGKLSRATDKTIKNYLARARRDFGALVKAEPDGSLKPLGQLEARIWEHVHLNPAAASEYEGVTIQPDPNDRDAVIVSGLRD